MPTSPTTTVIEHLRRTILLDRDDSRDEELLSSFIERQDEAALAALVRRHGSMVWGVCHRLLNHHDAEDAFQATFVVLVRKASSIRPREMVGNWLYGVAYRTALQARRTVARRSLREIQVAEMPDTMAKYHDQWSDLRSLLDEELSRLSSNYRAVLVLCDLEGLTRKEVARQLGVPEGTVAGWLARARSMLAKRLTQRGITLSGGGLGALLAESSLSGHMPNSLVEATIKAASQFATGTPEIPGAISPHVNALTEGVVKTMQMSKLKGIVVAVLFLGVVAAGLTIVLTHSTAGQEAKQQRAEQSEVPTTNSKQAPEGQPTQGKDDNPDTKPSLPKSQQAASDLDAMQGNWKVVGVEQEGKVAKPELLEFVKMRVVITKNKMTEWATMPDDGRDVSTGEVTFALDETASPKQFNGKSDAGELLGIYVFEAGKLKLCIDHDGKLRPTGFKSERGTHQRLLVLQRSDANHTEKQNDGSKNEAPKPRSKVSGGKGLPLRVRLKEVDSTKLVMTVDSVGIGFSDSNAQVNPFRLQNIPISLDATITDGKQDRKLNDLKQGDILLLQVESVADQNALVVTRIQIEDRKK